MNGGRLVVECLKQQGVEFVFGLVDTTILDILDALYDDESIRYVPVRHEQVASMAADGYSRTTGRPGVCLTQCGAGAMNLIYGIASAHRDSIPVIAITGNIESNLIGRDTWHDLDLTALYAPITKWSTRVTDVRDIPGTIENAFRIATSGRPGPVHISIPKDIQAMEVATLPHSPGLLPERTSPAPIAGDIERAIELLANAEHPVIFAGAGVLRANASDSLLAFSERTGIPVIITDTARGAIPESHPNALGTGGMFGLKAATDALQNADVVLGVGTRFPDFNTGTWQIFKPSAAIIQNNTDASEIGRRVRVAVGIVADARDCLDALLTEWEHTSRRAGPERAAQNAAMKEAVEAQRAAAFTPPAGSHQRIPNEALAREIAAVLGEDAIIAVDGGLHNFSTIKLRIERPGAFLISAGLGAMGYGLAAAIGAKAAQPERPVVALVGDGGFAMVSQDLETAVRCGINVVVVVFNNAAFGAQRLRQQRDYDGRFIGTKHTNPDFAELAALYGAEGRTISQVEDFAPAFAELLAKDCVGVIDVQTL